MPLAPQAGQHELHVVPRAISMTLDQEEALVHSQFDMAAPLPLLFQLSP